MTFSTTSTTAPSGSSSPDRLRFTIHVLKGPWFSFFASLLIMAAAGATYLFGTYSKEIKAQLGYDQTTLNLLGFFKDFGANVGVLSGLMAEVAPVWLVLLTGAALNFGGYFAIWLAVTHRIPKPKVWQMCIYICLGANSQNFCNTGALVTSIRNFPENRGVMIGLLKGWTGLSGAVMTQLYLAIYGNDTQSLILLIAWLPAAINIVFVYVIREMKVIRQPNELRIFYQVLYISVTLAFFIMVMTIIQKKFEFSKAGYIGSAIVCILMMFSPLLIAIRQESKIWKKMKQPTSPPTVKTENPPKFESKSIKRTTLGKSSSSSSDVQKKSCFNVRNIFFEKPHRGQDYTILQALLSTDMILLFIATFCGLGSSLTAVDNLGQMGESLGYPTKTVKSFVSLLSIWNFFGRIFSGYVSEYLLVTYKFPRPLMMTLMLVTSSIGLFMVAYPFTGSLYIASIIIGFSFGAQLPLLFAIISELFGLKYYSTLYNCGQLASPLGSYVLNVKLTGPLYDKEATKDLAKRGLKYVKGKELICLGKHCYRLPFTILAAVTFFGALVSLILVLRTREFYRGDIYERYRVESEPSEKELASSTFSKV